ncbi:hypothetical protein GQ44DRAFT_701112 [Phaeosphaeriaceae sp. PMI808]|nr:hypothetical protein GQ44DRAFT_701112 [Phaeosphaeriaceae sp. PMI808]
MNGHANGSGPNNFDIIVVGGGISGVNSAYRISTELPTSSFAVLESRHEIGGTWSLFTYPGVRSDSDLHTFGFAFNPWKSSNSIATGESILSYMKETVQKFNLEKHFKFRQKVQSADWKDAEQKWRLEVDVNDERGETKREIYWAKWIMLGTGYYDYEKGLDAHIPGLDSFKGKVVHPQFWPKDMEYKDKNVVIIGSGATTITLMPAMVNKGVRMVTQLQRSPSYVMSIPQQKPDDQGWLRKAVPEWLALKWLRAANILGAIVLYAFCQKYPARAIKFLNGQAKKLLPADFPIDPHLKPKYNPWDQRMCLCPDGDYFKCFESGRAKIVTDTIKTVTENGIELNSGERLDADIVVTATGLQMQLFGGMQIRTNGKPVDISSQYFWRMAMVTSLPNMGNIIGYWNHSWTLGSDASVHLYIRLIKRMLKDGYTSVVPEMSEEDKKKPDMAASPLSSTYVQNVISHMPRCKDSVAWQPRPNYIVDRWRVERCNLNDGLKWEKVST